MTYISERTKKSILESARKEFLEKGYGKASLRDIAAAAHMTTGAIYTHFKNKEEIFESLVGPTADALYSLYEEEFLKKKDQGDYLTEEMEENYEETTFTVLDFLYDHFEDMKLIFCCSADSKYESFRDKLIQIEEEATVWMLEEHQVELEEADFFFIHVMASAGVNHLVEVISHDLMKSQAIAYMKKIQDFHYAGWKKILEG